MRDEGGRGLDVRRSTEGARKKSGWFHPRKMRGLFTPPPSPRRPSLNRKIVTQPSERYSGVQFGHSMWVLEGAHNRYESAAAAATGTARLAQIPLTGLVPG